VYRRQTGGWESFWVECQSIESEWQQLVTTMWIIEVGADQIGTHVDFDEVFLLRPHLMNEPKQTRGVAAVKEPVNMSVSLWESKLIGSTPFPTT
jgi:hypothetical protein